MRVSTIPLVILFMASLLAQTVKNLSANAGDIKEAGSIHGPGRSPREGNGTLLQYSYLENSMYRGAWQATVHGAVTWTWVSEHMDPFSLLRRQSVLGIFNCFE